MRIFVLGLLGSLALGASALAADAPMQTQVQVMIVGIFHMSNPGRDLHNLTVDDVLAPKRQAEIEAVNDGLARFHPTVVDVEWSAEDTSRYAAYLNGTLPPSRNEVVQLGFRLAKTSGLAAVHGIDVDGDFPYDPVDAYAKVHGQSALLDHENDVVQAFVDHMAGILAKGSIGDNLRFLNDPARLSTDNAFYRDMLRVGGGADQPGAELLTAWYHRNLLICANLVQQANPGDRVVVFYGSGHAFLLRQCVSETPGFTLVEPNDYLPK